MFLDVHPRNLGEDDSHFWEIIFLNHRGVMTFPWQWLTACAWRRATGLTIKFAANSIARTWSVAIVPILNQKESPTKQIQVRNEKIIILELLSWFIFTFYHSKSPLNQPLNKASYFLALGWWKNLQIPDWQDVTWGVMVYSTVLRTPLEFGSKVRWKMGCEDGMWSKRYRKGRILTLRIHTVG